MAFREARLCELTAELAFLENTLPAWTVEAYKSAERAFRLVEGEHSKGKPKNDMQITPTGSTAFADIEAAAMARKAPADDIETVNRYLDGHPETIQDICDFMRTHQ